MDYWLVNQNLVVILGQKRLGTLKNLSVGRYWQYLCCSLRFYNNGNGILKCLVEEIFCWWWLVSCSFCKKDIWLEKCYRCCDHLGLLSVYEDDVCIDNARLKHSFPWLYEVSVKTAASLEVEKGIWYDKAWFWRSIQETRCLSVKN